MDYGYAYNVPPDYGEPVAVEGGYVDQSSAPGFWEVFAQPETAASLVTIGGAVVGGISNLIEQRRNSLSSLQRRRSKLLADLSGGKSVAKKTQIVNEIKAIDMQIAQLQSAIAMGAPPMAGELEGYASSADSSVVPWVVGGGAALALLGVIAYLATKD